MTESDWLALELITESGQAHEWHPLAWVARNRVGTSARRESILDVVTEPRQFSHFNDFQELLEDLREGRLEAEIVAYDRILGGIADDGRRVRKLSRELLALAKLAAADFLAEPVWRRPFGPRVLHYWSPVSMVPKGSRPAWAAQAKRLFTPSGVDPERFVFAEGVP